MFNKFKKLVHLLVLVSLVTTTSFIGIFLIMTGIANLCNTLNPTLYVIELDSDFDVWLRDFMLCFWSWVTFMGIVINVCSAIILNRIPQIEQEAYKPINAFYCYMLAWIS